MPSRLGYLLALIILVAGAVGATLFALPRIQGLGSGLQQIVVPGDAELALDEPGTYTIFHESRSIVDGELYTSGDVSGLGVEITSARDGSAVDLAAPTVDASYDFAGRSGRAFLAFTISKPGPYRLSAGYRDNRNGSRVVLAVGYGFVGRIFSIVAGTFAVGFAGLVMAVALGGVTFVRRRNAKRALTA